MVQNRYVVVMSIPRESALGLHKWSDPTSGKLIKKNKVGEAIDVFSVPYSKKRGGLANYISYTPWLDDNGNVKQDANGNQLTLQDKYEQLYNKPKGYYSNVPVLQQHIGTGERTFFQDLKIRLNDGATIFDLNVPDDLMRYYVLLELRHVANNEKEWRNHKWPEAKYYIAAENESEEIKYKAAEAKARASSLLFDESLTNEIKRRVCVLLGVANAKAHLSNEQLFNLLFSYINDSDKATNQQRFVTLVNLLKTDVGRQEFEARFMLQEAADYRIIYEKGSTWTWPREKGNIVIGDTLSEAVAWMNNPKKAVLVEELLTAVTDKKKATEI